MAFYVVIAGEWFAGNQPWSISIICIHGLDRSSAACGKEEAKMTTEEDASQEESPRGGGAGYRALTVINYVIGALGCAVLAFAIWLPESIGGKWGCAQRERNW